MSLAKKIHLRPEEEIIKIIRSSPLTEWWKYALGLAFLVVASFFTFWLFARGWWGQIIFAFGIIAGVYIILRAWFFNYHNYLVVTSDRIADISRASWFEEVVSSIGYHDLKDIVVHRRGVFAAIFNYGTLTVETKDKNLVLEIARVRMPQQVQNIILETEEAFRSGLQVKNSERILASFTRLIPDLSEAELTLVDKKIHDQLHKFDATSPEEEVEVL